jgi:hypothetical protein
MEFPSRDGGGGGGKEGISNLSMFTYKRKRRMRLQAPYFINCAVCNDSYEKALEKSLKGSVFSDTYWFLIQLDLYIRIRYGYGFRIRTWMDDQHGRLKDKMKIFLVFRSRMSYLKGWRLLLELEKFVVEV